MTDRTINLPEHVYDDIMELKDKNESISDFIARLIKKKQLKKSITQFAGIFEIFEDSSEEWEKIEKKLYDDRLRQSNERTIKF
jgi:predicted CopG family antitoxin